MKRLALILALLPGVVQAGEWWQGVWAFDPAWCAQADKVGSVTPAPIKITETEILGYENSCTIAKSREAGDLNAVFMALICTGEGETYDDARLIMRGESSIWMWFGADAPVQFHRCEV